MGNKTRVHGAKKFFVQFPEKLFLKTAIKDQYRDI